jgi:Cys-tRNA(Pro)/Cys-tRNA(Cys) deacylase
LFVYAHFARFFFFSACFCVYCRKDKGDNMRKTNAMRLLESAGADYTPHQIDWDPDMDGQDVAAKLGRPAEAVFKTLVTIAGKDLYVFMVPVNGHLSLKKAAKAAGVKSLAMLPQKSLQSMTGYIHGGCSPLGMKKPYPVWMDQSALGQAAICFSAGKTGMQVEMDPGALASLFHIQPADLVEA